MIKNFKKGLLITSILLVFFLVIGSIYAYDNFDALALENEGINVEIENNTIYHIISNIVDNKKVDGSLITLNYYQKNKDYYAKLIWNSKKGGKYQILRKLNGDYEVISTVTANSTKTVFTDKIDKNKIYTYSVRKVMENSNGELIFDSYDEEGLKLLSRPSVKVDFQNLKSDISWSKVDGATKYCVFRKNSDDGEYKCIATLDGNQTNYTEYFYKTPEEFPGKLIEKTFLDPTYNSLHYTVRAYNTKKTNNIEKTSCSLYSNNGDFHLEAPSIISLKNNKIKWGRVHNAEGYIILKSDNPDGEWEEIAKVKGNSKLTRTKKLENVDNNSYYTVKAYSHKNGKKIYSDYEKGFTLKNSKGHSNEKILYIGDSITYASPYKSPQTRHIYSIPYRVGELLGCTYYNPSIPGSTYHDLGQNFWGKNVENGQYYRYRICREVVDQISEGELPGNWESLDTAKNSLGQSHTTIEDYNIVVLAAGTNDYLDNTELGSSDSNDVSTFNGAVNHIMEKIEQASKNRVKDGKEPIKVIFVDLYYSDRTNDYTVKHNRDITPNNLGLTLTDYQDALDKQLLKWESNSKDLTFYNFETRKYNIVNEENCPYTASDNLHFTRFAYGQYGDAFAQFLLDEVF